MGKATRGLCFPVEAQPRFLKFVIFEFFFDWDGFQRNRAIDSRILGEMTVFITVEVVLV